MNFSPSPLTHSDALREMEMLFATDFSTVRILESPRAAALGVSAFCNGESIHIAPGVRVERRLLAHELTHVLQQRAGRVSAPPTLGRWILMDPNLEAEAVENGKRAVLGTTPLLYGSSLQPVSLSRVIQCDFGIPSSVQIYKESLKGSEETSKQDTTTKFWMYSSKIAHDGWNWHITVYPHPRGSDMSDNFHVTYNKIRGEQKFGEGGKWLREQPVESTTVHFYFDDLGGYDEESVSNMREVNKPAHKQLWDHAWLIAKAFAANIV
jgi:hypothetical protein